MASSISSSSGLASMFSSFKLCGSGADCAGGGSVPSSVTKTCAYYDILIYFGISMVIFKFEASNLAHIK